MRKVIFVLAAIAAFISLFPAPAASGVLSAIFGHILELGAEDPLSKVPLVKPTTKLVPLEPVAGATTEGGASTAAGTSHFGTSDSSAGAKAAGGSSTGDGTSQSGSGQSSAGPEDAASAGANSHGDKSGKASEFGLEAGSSRRRGSPPPSKPNTEAGAGAGAGAGLAAIAIAFAATRTV